MTQKKVLKNGKNHLYMKKNENIERLCQFCGVEYLLNKNYSKKQIDESKFCSRECQYKGRTIRVRLAKKIITITCAVCNEGFKEYASNRRYKFAYCSRKCYGVAASNNIKGKKHYNWKGGITPKNKAIRRSKEYREWREKVFTRDGWKCVWCGVAGGILHADHIKPFAYFPSLRLEISNGRTLCKPCHEKTTTYKKHLPNQEQIITYA